jgi:hypothetical protein
MSNYLGYKNAGPYFDGIVEKSDMPAKRIASDQDLKLLSEYFQIFSKEEAEIRGESNQNRSLVSLFRPIIPKTGIPPGGVITLVDYDPKNRWIYVGWANKNVLQRYSTDWALSFTRKFTSEPVHVEFLPQGLRVALMGHFLFNAKEGEILDISISKESAISESPVVENFDRLVKSITRDVDEDGELDLLVVGFGDGKKGRVLLRWGGERVDSSRDSVLIDYSGAVAAEILDVNMDGQLDVLVLTSQAQQELLLFAGGGNRKFDRKVLRKEFAGFGFNHFSLSDFNKDGLVDILLSNGNNMEMEYAPLKPYHGVRILENRGEGKFVERFFSPIYGATKALAADFDSDGDLDIAVIAYYPDWGVAVPETFVYLECQGGYQYKPQVLAAGDWGRWITMAVGDLDGDQDDDIILGGAYYPIGVNRSYLRNYLERIRGRPSVVVLNNERFLQPVQ